MNLFGKKRGPGGPVEGLGWMTLIKEAQVQNTVMNNLHNVYHENKSMGRWLVARQYSFGLQNFGPQ